MNDTKVYYGENLKRFGKYSDSTVYESLILGQEYMIRVETTDLHETTKYYFTH